MIEQGCRRRHDRLEIGESKFFVTNSRKADDGINSQTEKGNGIILLTKEKCAFDGFSGKEERRRKRDLLHSRRSLGTENQRCTLLGFLGGPPGGLISAGHIAGIA